MNSINPRVRQANCFRRMRCGQIILKHEMTMLFGYNMFKCQESRVTTFAHTFSKFIFNLSFRSALIRFPFITAKWEKGARKKLSSVGAFARFANGNEKNVFEEFHICKLNHVAQGTKEVVRSPFFAFQKCCWHFGICYTKTPKKNSSLFSSCCSVINLFSTFIIIFDSVRDASTNT